MSAQDALTLHVPCSSRLNNLPTYIFAELDELKAAARARGADLIDLGIGSPDIPTPKPILDALEASVTKPENHGYPPFAGKPQFRQAAVDWMKRRYGVDGLDPEREVQSLIGSKEGLAHLSLGYIEPGDISLVPSPYYPVHSRATWIAGGDVYHMPLTEANQYLPDLDAIPADICKRAKLLFISYPHNPTSAVADLAFYEKAVAFCKQHNIVLISDMAYAEITFDGYKAPSIFNVPGAKDVAVEFHSFSKTFSMAGWRIGFAVGNADIIKTLYRIKTNMDYGVCSVAQDGAIAAMTLGEPYLPAIVAEYKARRDVVIDGFRAMGWPTKSPKGAIYVWLPVPQGYTSKQWTQKLIDEADVVVTPGIAFGQEGEGYFRISLVRPPEVLQEAVRRIQATGVRFS